MKILIGNDHAGTPIKPALLSYIESVGLPFKNFGTDTTDSVDYPDYTKILASEMKSSSESIGILICGTGIGMSIAANRYSHIRAALCHNVEYANLARSHNNANVLILGARFLTNDYATAILKEFIATPFTGGRHQNRIDKINNL